MPVGMTEKNQNNIFLFTLMTLWLFINATTVKYTEIAIIKKSILIEYFENITFLFLNRILIIPKIDIPPTSIDILKLRIGG